MKLRIEYRVTVHFGGRDAAILQSVANGFINEEPAQEIEVKRLMIGTADDFSQTMTDINHVHRLMKTVAEETNAELVELVPNETINS